MGNGKSGPKYMEPIKVRAIPAKTNNKNKLIFQPFIDMDMNNNYNEYLGNYFIHYYDNYFYFLFLITIIIIFIFLFLIFLLLTCSYKNRKKKI